MRAEADERADALHLRAQRVRAKSHVARRRAKQTGEDREHRGLASAVMTFAEKERLRRKNSSSIDCVGRHSTCSN